MEKQMYYGIQTKQMASEYINFRNAQIGLIGGTWIWMSFTNKKEKKNQSELPSHLNDEINN